jgi:hypothetical protein
MPTNDGDLGKAVSHVDSMPALDGEHPGYETTDVNVSGVIVFLGGLMGFLVIFFVVCFGIGKLINNQLSESDGPTDKWHAKSVLEGGGKREDLTSNAVMQQKELAQMTQSFPTPRLDTDDGNQATADLHAREDLLLEHYSSNNGTVRIPIERAMELVAGKLPVVAQGSAPTTLMAGDAHPAPQVPLTSGFARTGYELDVMEARKQKMSFAKAVGKE